VQLAALNSRGEADAMARRLTSKGYAAYVVAPPGGTPAVFRVRVGTFDTRREAETVAARLQREEQFKPWITR
jgi:cell division septation protein DedD